MHFPKAKRLLFSDTLSATGFDPDHSSDELRPKYRRSDFSTLVRGKYAARLARESNIVVLEPEIAKAFPNDKAVNEALRVLLEVAATTARLTSRSAGRGKKRRAG